MGNPIICWFDALDSAAYLRRRGPGSEVSVIYRIEWSEGEHRYRAAVVSNPVTAADEKANVSRAFWTITRDKGPVVRAFDAMPDDVEGPELRERLKRALEP